MYSLFFIPSLYSNPSLSQEQVLQKRISIPPQRVTLYQALNLITERTGYFFIYDSRAIDNERKVKLEADSQTVQEVLARILDDPSLQYRVIESHILIYRANVSIDRAGRVKPNDSASFFTIRGRIYDMQNHEAIPYAAIGIAEENIGTITNADGVFAIKIPRHYLKSNITISHLGYKSLTVPAELLANQSVDLYIETEYVSIQEVIIRNIDPRSIVQEALRRREANYSTEPVYITSFYREGVKKRDTYINYSESVIKVYKTSYLRGVEHDQVKLLKSRKVSNIDQKDTLILKLKAGIKSCLSLDIVKSLPNFLDEEFYDNYTFTKSDIVSINSRNAYAISFEQKDNITDPLYKGLLYIDMENFAVHSADFEINPDFVDAATEQFIVKKNRSFVARSQKISYSVSYKLWNSKYYMNHIRGDLKFKIRKRRHLMFNEFHAFMEMASCQLDTLNVERFSRREVLRPNAVFMDGNYSYDHEFWGDYNIISPEESISQALAKVSQKIEKIEASNDSNAGNPE